MSTRICVFAVMLICSGAVTTAVAPTSATMDNICLLLKNKALIASAASCTDYYLCSNGVAIPQSCSSGSYFDKDTQTCLTQPPSYCSSSNTNPCDGFPIGSYVPVPGSCSGFYYCSAEGALRSDCPNSLVFNPTTQSCDYRTNSNCPDPTQTGSENAAAVTLNLCSYVQNGIYFGDAFNCSGWEICHSNTSTTGTCKDGLLYDATVAMCNYPAYVNCTQVTYDPNLNVNSANNGGTCTQNGGVKKGIPCNQYYVCNNGNWQLQVCSGSLYFDNESQKCVNRLNAYNDCDRCLGTTKQFVNEFGTNCTGYSYCSNGVQSNSGTCGSGLFFNEVLGGCVDENPDFVFCKSAPTTTVSPVTTVKPDAEATTVKPAAEATTVKPDAEATTVKPDAEATTVKPDAEATTVKPDAEATTVKPDAEATTVKPDAEATTVKPDAEATTVKPAA